MKFARMLRVGMFLLPGLVWACTATTTTDDRGSRGNGGAGGEDVDPRLLGGAGGTSDGVGGAAGEGNQPPIGGAAGTNDPPPGGSGGVPPAGGKGGVAMPMGGQAGTSASGRPPCATNPYCENFDKIDVGGRPWGISRVSGGNTLAVAEDRAFSGKRSLYVAASGGQAEVAVNVRDLFSNTKAAGYMRMMVWLDNLPGGVSPGHWSFMGIDGMGYDAKIGRFGVGISYGGFGDDSSRFLYAGAGADCTKTARPPVMPLKKWVCVEMKADATQALDYGLKIDGKDIGAFSFADNNVGSGCYMQGSLKNVWYVPDPMNLTYGWMYWHTQGRPIRMWIDDVVADEKPIGCPAP